MTVKELITELQKIEDQEKKVVAGWENNYAFVKLLEENIVFDPFDFSTRQPAVLITI